MCMPPARHWYWPARLGQERLSVNRVVRSLRNRPASALGRHALKAVIRPEGRQMGWPIGPFGPEGFDQAGRQGPAHVADHPEALTGVHVRDTEGMLELPSVCRLLESPRGTALRTFSRPLRGQQLGLR